MNFHLLDGITTFLFVMTYLLTDNRYIIIIAFAVLVLLYDIRAGETPIISLPKLLLRRNEWIDGINIIMSQVLGMITAVISYKLLVKYNFVTKHKLE
jgi:hypothetical protein